MPRAPRVGVGIRRTAGQRGHREDTRRGFGGVDQDNLARPFKKDNFMILEVASATLEVNGAKGAAQKL
eukprot:4095667-Heterocapsa_arctica.AAC.1